MCNVDRQMFYLFSSWINALHVAASPTFRSFGPSLNVEFDLEYKALYFSSWKIYKKYLESINGHDSLGGSVSAVSRDCCLL